MNRTTLDQRLRADAVLVRQAPTPDLHESILASLEEAAPHMPVNEIRRRPWRPMLAAAAALLAVASLWSLASRTPHAPGADDTAPSVLSGDVVALSRDLLDPPLLASMGQLKDPLLTEARNLWADTSRAAESVARGLRTPLRLRTN